MCTTPPSWGLAAAPAAWAAAVLVLASGPSWADWRYGSQTDRMSDQKTLFASIESNNQIGANSIIGSGGYLNLFIYKSGKSNPGAYIELDRGLIECPGRRCQITVRFGDEPANKLQAVVPADGGRQRLIIEGAAKLVKAAAQSPVFLLQVHLWRQGAQVAEFHSAKPLQWPLPAIP